MNESAPREFIDLLVQPKPRPAEVQIQVQGPDLDKLLVPENLPILFGMIEAVVKRWGDMDRMYTERELAELVPEPFRTACRNTL